jgi:hypothetical protein
MLPKIGDERWTAEHVSYRQWCKLARARGWSGDQDALRTYCEPGEAATVTIHPSLDAAKAWAASIFKNAPDDSAFGIIIIKHQTFKSPIDLFQALATAHEDQDYLASGCRPQWETDCIFEMTADGAVLESQVE